MTILQKLQNKELTLSDLFSLTKEYVTSSVGRIISNGILLSLPAIACYITVVFAFGLGLFATLIKVSDKGMYANVPTSFGTEFFLSLIIGAILFIAIGAWHTAALQTWIHRDISDLKPGFKDSASIALKRTGRVVATQVLSGIIVGVMTLIIPLIIVIIVGFTGAFRTPLPVNFATLPTYDPNMLWAVLAMVIPVLLFILLALFISTYFRFAQSIAVVRESISPWVAIKRSIAIVKGRFWRVFGRILAGGALLLATDFVSRILLNIIGSIHDGLGVLASLVYFVAYMALCYFVFIYEFFLFINLDSSKPENPVVIN